MSKRLPWAWATFALLCLVAIDRVIAHEFDDFPKIETPAYKPGPPLAPEVRQKALDEQAAKIKQGNAINGARSADVNTAPTVTDMYFDPGTGSIRGHVYNGSSLGCAAVRVGFKLYDAEGSVIGEASDTVSNLGAYESWAFDAYTFGKRPASFKLLGVRFR